MSAVVDYLAQESLRSYTSRVRGRTSGRTTDVRDHGSRQDFHDEEVADVVPFMTFDLRHAYQDYTKDCEFQSLWRSCFMIFPMKGFDMARHHRTTADVDSIHPGVVGISIYAQMLLYYLKELT